MCFSVPWPIYQSVAPVDFSFSQAVFVWSVSISFGFSYGMKVDLVFSFCLQPHADDYVSLDIVPNFEVAMYANGALNLYPVRKQNSKSI